MATIRLEAAELERWLDGAPRKIFAAQRSAIGTTATFVNQELKRRIVQATGLPVSVFNKVRLRKRVSSTSASVWLGYNPIKAAYLGKLRQTARGAYAGKVYFPKAFMATMRSGHESIFKRTGEKRTPAQIARGMLREEIKEQVVALEKFQVNAITAEVEVLARIELQRRYHEKLQQLLSRSGP